MGIYCAFRSFPLPLPLDDIQFFPCVQRCKKCLELITQKDAISRPFTPFNEIIAFPFFIFSPTSSFFIYFPNDPPLSPKFLHYLHVYIVTIVTW